MGVTAIIVAITFSAFTIKRHASNVTTLTAFYWYPVDASGNIIGPKVNSNPLVKEDELRESDCNDAEFQPACLGGSEDPSLTTSNSITLDEVNFTNEIRESDQ